MRDDNFDTADEQSKEAQRGDPVRDADEGRVPGSFRSGRDGSGKTRDASRIRHFGIIPRSRMLRVLSVQFTETSLLVWSLSIAVARSVMIAQTKMNTAIDVAE